MRHWKVLAVCAAGAGMLALLAGLVGGVAAPVVMLRMVLAAAVFALLAAVAMAVLERFVPDVLRLSGGGETASAVDITLPEENPHANGATESDDEAAELTDIDDDGGVADLEDADADEPTSDAAVAADTAANGDGPPELMDESAATALHAADSGEQLPEEAAGLDAEHDPPADIGDTAVPARPAAAAGGVEAVADDLALESLEPLNAADDDGADDTADTAVAAHGDAGATDERRSSGPRSDGLGDIEALGMQSLPADDAVAATAAPGAAQDAATPYGNATDVAKAIRTILSRGE